MNIHLKTYAAALLTVVLQPICAQTSNRYHPPRTADGKPSLEGNWTNASLTSLQRPERYKSLTIDARDIERETNNHPQVVRQRTDDEQDENTARDGSDLGRGRGYNAFWIDPGMTFNQVRGEYRTSFVVDPPNGQIPFKNPPRERGDARLRSFDGPEARPLGERCVINSGSAGPPMLTYLYNNNYEIAQTPTHVAIRVEMNNYTRIVRIGGQHLPPGIRPMHGDSIGHWEGETLVVETTNFSPLHANGQIGLTAQGKVTERFSRVSATQLLYEFTVEDPARYTQAWRGEYSFNATPGRVYEYACHEGNYALPGILAGARAQEKAPADR
jgi:hypothetical protein